ncbi:Uncharacterized protein APZ42_009129, partial [Daphnia magna]
LDRHILGINIQYAEKGKIVLKTLGMIVIYSLTTDNGSNMIKSVQLFLDGDEGKEDIDFDELDINNDEEKEELVINELSESIRDVVRGF